MYLQHEWFLKKLELKAASEMLTEKLTASAFEVVPNLLTIFNVEFAKQNKNLFDQWCP